MAHKKHQVQDKTKRGDQIKPHWTNWRFLRGCQNSLSDLTGPLESSGQSQRPLSLDRRFLLDCQNSLDCKNAATNQNQNSTGLSDLTELSESSDPRPKLTGLSIPAGRPGDDVGFLPEQVKAGLVDPARYVAVS